jgi:hypothetical protein
MKPEIKRRALLRVTLPCVFLASVALLNVTVKGPDRSLSTSIEKLLKD